MHGRRRLDFRHCGDRLRRNGRLRRTRFDGPWLLGGGVRF
jgi:hypothetical protein